MKKVTLGLFAVLFLSFIIAAQPEPSQSPADVIEIEIQVSPQTILLNWKARGDVKVTVHADVSFNLFTSSTLVKLGGMPAYYIKADNRGELVAKFDFDKIAELVGPGNAILTLEATDKDGNTYVGSDEVRVVG